MSIVTVSSLPAHKPAKDDCILIEDQFKTTVGELEDYLNPHRPDVGRNLVTVLGVSNARAAWAELRRRADAGNFAGLRIGDYIDIDSMAIEGQTISNANQRLRFIIAGFDTYYRVGDTEITSHHILMIARNCVFQKAMNSNNSNVGGYPKSELKAYLNGTVKPGLVSAIGITPKTVRRLLDTNESDNWKWTAEEVFIPTEVEVFGCRAWSDKEGYAVGSSVQWPIFSSYPQMRIANWNGSRWWWWEASPAYDNPAYFCNCSSDGTAYSYSASNSSLGVRFAFLV